MTAYRRLKNGPKDAPFTMIFAHGSGAAMDTPFMDAVAKGISATGIQVIRFEFPYMQLIRATGKRRPPDRAPILAEHWREEIRICGAEPASVFLAGKSMGGRVASLIADEFEVAGLVCMGYPFHPPGRPEKLRTEHLADLKTPTLILQGERDTFGTPDEVAGYDLSAAISVEWVPDGDHSFKPRKKSGHTEESNIDFTIETIASFTGALTNTSR